MSMSEGGYDMSFYRLEYFWVESLERNLKMSVKRMGASLSWIIFGLL